MTPPKRDTPAGRAYNDLRNLARRDGRDPGEYLTLYALEGFLTRLVQSSHADDFVFKGGVLMAAFTARRPSRDIDLSAVRVPNDVDEVKMRVKDILALDREDGLAFDPESVSGKVIRDDADYTGVRVTSTASLSTARIALHVKVHREEQVKARMAAKVWVDPDLVFATSVGTALEPRNVSRAWEALRVRARVPGIRVHAFAEGASVKEVQAMLRHTRQATTADVYVHVMESVRQGTASKMDDVLERVMTAP